MTPRADGPGARRRRGKQVWARFDVAHWEHLRALKIATAGAVTPAALLDELIECHLPSDVGEVVALVRDFDRERIAPPETDEHVFRLTPATHAKLVQVELAVKCELDWVTRADLLGALLDRAAPSSAAEAKRRIHQHERLRRHGSADPYLGMTSTASIASPTAAKTS